jgi:hypothetical protein
VSFRPFEALTQRNLILNRVPLAAQGPPREHAAGRIIPDDLGVDGRDRRPALTVSLGGALAVDDPGNRVPRHTEVRGDHAVRHASVGERQRLGGAGWVPGLGIV